MDGFWIPIIGWILDSRDNGWILDPNDNGWILDPNNGWILDPNDNGFLDSTDGSILDSYDMDESSLDSNRMDGFWIPFHGWILDTIPWMYFKQIQMDGRCTY